MEHFEVRIVQRKDRELKGECKTEEESHLEEVASLHAAPDDHEVEPVRVRLVATLCDVESVSALIVLLIQLSVLQHQDAIRSCGFEHGTACIEIALPVLLHDSVHYLGFHDCERVQMLQIVKRLPAHHVNLADLILHLLREEKVDQDGLHMRLHQLS